MDPVLSLIIEAAVKVGLLIGGMMTAAAYLVLLERWIAAWVQDRIGPNRVGLPLTKIKLFGLGQPMADGAKFILKEEYTPAHVDKGLYLAAPISILVTALAVFAVIPVGAALPIIPGMDHAIQLIAAPGMDVGLIFVFAMGSLSVYGVILGGWASNNKYSFLGGLRSSAQLIAYELPMGLGILGIVLAAGSLRLEDIIQQQAVTGQWNCFTQPIGLLVFVVAAFAEAARLPFDLPEAEQELIGGYHTEYAGLKLLLFLVAEFLHMVTAAFLIAILFFGGWHVWGLPTEHDVGWGWAIARVVILSAKVLAVIVFFMLVRWSWPRFRFDQLMNLAWKVMLPLGLINVAIAAIVYEFIHVPGQGAATAIPGWLIAANWLIAVGVWVASALLAPEHLENRPAMTAPSNS